MFEEARAAAEAALSNPQHSSQEAMNTSDNAPDVRLDAPEEKVPDILDLDSVEKFKWQGDEWTLDKLQKSIMFHNDYTRKTQTLAEERKALLEEKKFSDNFAQDLSSVLKNPSLVSEFKSIYPKKYHHVVDEYLTRYNPQNTQQPSALGGEQRPVENKIPAELVNRLDRLEQTLEESAIAAMDAEIDSIFTKMSQKYPLANQDLVVARAQSLLEKDKGFFQGNNGHQSPEAWERVWKSVNDQLSKSYESHYKQQFEQQKKASQQAKDVGTGGAIPSQAPKKMSFKGDEIVRHATEVLSGRR